MSKKQLFTLFPRKMKNEKIIYYYSIYDNSKRRQFSTKLTDKNEAYQYVYKQISEGKLIKNCELNFGKITAYYFIWKSCPYYNLREAKGNTYGRSSMERKRRILELHILPFFKKKRIDFITAGDIETWLTDKKQDGYSINTINNYLSILKLIINEQHRLGVIVSNPCKLIIPFKKIETTKGILNRDEIEELFNIDNIDRVWNGNMLHYLLNKVLSVGGLRTGEVQALKQSNIHENHIVVEHSWDRKYGLKSTKANKTRFVPIPKVLSVELLTFYMQEHGDYIFQGIKSTPVNHKTIEKYYKQALVNIGISDETRKIRSLTLHSYRHMVNTRYLEANVPESTIREIIGHSSSKLTSHYCQTDTREISYDSLNII